MTPPSLGKVVEADLANILIGSSLAEAEWLSLAEADPATCCTSLDAQLLDWLQNSREDRHSQLVRRVLPVLSDTVVSELGARLHCSQRTLERSFQRVTGLTLKQYQSMVRLELMLLWLYQHAENSVDWADVAQRFGFSDQPHLIRYFRDRIGATPGRYARQRDLTIDVYGDFE